ncbi:MAG: hypothetical protein R2874_00105 [Desulfobacterales bacterium]
MRFSCLMWSVGLPLVPELPDAMIQDRFELARKEMTALFSELKEKLVAAGFHAIKSPKRSSPVN